ncbi:MAG: PfkB family carbohydrate kinase [Fidelibacterota bacterium]
MKHYDTVIFGNYTSDTIITKQGSRHVDGGGFNYGAHAAVGLGYKVAAVTRLAKADSHVISMLENAGIDVFPTFTSSSTQMVLDYPTDNPDERILTCPQTAGSYTIDQFRDFRAKAWLINTSVREEAPVELVEYLHAQPGLLVADAQGFVRVRGEGGRLIHAEWPQKRHVLSMLNILKADIKEAESLTGESDLKKAAKILNEWGPAEIVLTHRSGILVYADGKYYEAGFFPEKLIGRSGRGDTCIALYAAKRLSAPPEEAIIWSAAVTSLKMEADSPFLRPLGDVEKLIERRYR